MEYTGEHLLPGQIGHFFIVLSFVASLLAAWAYFMATERRESAEFASWRKIGRYAFVVHGFATIGIIVTLFMILVKKYYEYEYAFANVSDDLPFKYTFSAFWKEQQGSFLLWSFWNIVLSAVLIYKSDKWESPVLSVISLAEGFIASMLLGLYFGSKRIGASPFDLLREASVAPIFKDPDYLSKISGNGLNPLLQNYWMTIHPPTLFLGFASTIVPFGFAIAGLWMREHKDWLKPALPWALFSGAILGTGILMGGAWAYEALTFGGYWAWDPVENTSLVPWLVLVAGIHTHLIARSTGYSIKSTYLYYLLSFIMVLYSTYLTRSGILGNSSVHSFTEIGLGLQLVLFIGVFIVLAKVLYLRRQSRIPTLVAEESSKSREFWMFIGALVLFFSAVLITGSTSLPIWNKVVQYFEPKYVGAALRDPIAHHNRYQLWIGVFIGLLTGVAQLMRYNERNWSAWSSKFVQHIGIAAMAALVLSGLNSLWLEAHAWQYFVLLFAGMFAISANAAYLIGMIKGNLKLAASVFSHVGFGLLILGILGTGLNKAWVSSNVFAMDGLVAGSNAETMAKNILLIRNETMPMAMGFAATYVGDTVERQTRSFKVDFKKVDEKGQPTGETFEVYPNVMYDRQFSQIVAYNPSTKHYWNRDIFTKITALPRAELDTEYARQLEDSVHYVHFEAKVGDTLFAKKHFYVVEGLSKRPQHPDYKPAPGDLAYGLQMRAYAIGDTGLGKPMQPVMYIRQSEGGYSLSSTVASMQVKARLTEASMERIFQTEKELNYKTYPLKQGDSFEYQGYKVHFSSVEKNIKHPNYQAQKGDAAVAAVLEITAPNGQKAQALPVYLLRDSQPYSLKDEVPSMGLHFQFESIDPYTGTLNIAVAKASDAQRTIPVEIAEDAPLGDYIFLEAILFPGINLVWGGAILMMIGLAMAWVYRRK